MTNKTFRISGRVIEQATCQGVVDLRVEAWDKELISDALLGSTVTESDGTFQISFDESHCQELFSDQQPDIYFKVYKQKELIKSTEDSVLWNIKEHEKEVVIELESLTIVTDNPTWDYPIKSFFNNIDVNHMLKITQGKLNLSKYEDVTSDEWRDGIYQRVSDKTMPVPPSEVWSDEMIATYKLWLDNGYPKSQS